jgi:hypothetical protein
MKNKSGTPRLRPLNFAQLEELLGRSPKAKDKAKIRSRMAVLLKRNPALGVKAEVVETAVEE